MRPMPLATVKTRMRKRRSGRIGSAARRSATTKATVVRDRDRHQREDGRRVPGVGRAAEAGEEDDRRQRRGQEPGAGVVDDVAAPCRRRLEHDGDDRQRGGADGQVDVEDPAPREVLDEVAAEQRPDDRRDAEDRAEEALVAAAIAWRDDVADRRHRGHDQPAAAQALQGAEGDQLAHVLRHAAQGGADQEQHDRDLQHELAAVQVAELAVDRRGDRGRQQVRRDHPRQVLDAAEVADDRRQRRGDDRLVEGRQEQHEHQRREDHADALGRLRGRRRPGRG